MTFYGRLFPRAILLGLAFALTLSPAMAGGGASEAAPVQDLVVLIGRYACNAITYGVVDEPPITMLDHSISFSGTGLQIPPGPAPGFGGVVGPGFGGRRPPGPPTPPAVPIGNLGLSTSVNLGQGTMEQCTSIAQSIAAAGKEKKCVVSPVRSNSIPSSVVGNATFSLVCEGDAADQVHIIGDLSRAVVTAELP